MYTRMQHILADLVEAGRWTMEQVPERDRAAVQAILDERKNEA